MSAKKDKSDRAEPASSNGNTSTSHDRPECFVIMPISDPEGYESGHFRRVYEDLFIPACESVEYKAVRADEVRQTNLIHLDVLQKIIESPMALCDLSSRNPNVLFELGLRQAFDKPVVLVQEVGTLPIFDINPLRYASYRREMLYRQVIEDQKEIAEAIRETREAIGDNKNINSIVKLLSLTHPASLSSIKEGDKDTAMFQVLMSEIGNLRAEFRNMLQRTGETEAYAQTRIGSVGDALAATYVKKVLDDIESNYDYLRSGRRPLEEVESEIKILLADIEHTVGLIPDSITLSPDRARAKILRRKLLALNDSITKELSARRSE